MMFSGDVDLEELEAMLYSQIHHGNTDIQNDPSLTTTTVVPTATGNPKINSECLSNARQLDPKNYHGLDYATDQPTFTNSVDIPQFLNAVITNQCMLNQDILTHLQKIRNWSKTLKSALISFETGKMSKQNLIKKLKVEINILKRRDKRKQKRKDKNSKTLHENIREIESSSSDVIVLDDEHEQPESDEEIIYVAPPPVPVISIDTDSEEEIEKYAAAEMQEFAVTAEEEISNDFIGNHEEQNTPQFNFSLHGSDFANNEFVRPANPSEAYETESSTSTSDFARESSRNFNNSVKTIVFNEVEFPKEDIFTANLDSFHEFVNPPQSNISKAKDQCSSQLVAAQKKNNPTKTSSDSSSESDYEIPLENLPSLSPMVSTLDTRAEAKSMKRNIDQLYENDSLRKTHPSSDAPKKKNKKKKKKSRQKSLEGEISQSFVSGLDNNLSVEQSLTDLGASNSNQSAITVITESIQEDSTNKKARKRKPKDDDRNGENNSVPQISENLNESAIVIDGNLTEEIEKDCETVSEPEVMIVEQEISQIEILDSSSEDSIVAVEVFEDLRMANISMSSLDLDKDFHEFDVENLQKKMSDDPLLWQVSAKDRLGTTSKKGVRCRRCRQFGHVSLNCSNKTSPPTCTLCGDIGHREPRCPNKVCFSCGNAGEFSTIYCWKCVKNRSKVCSTCGIYGHISRDCPDMWRRYHLTTKAGPLITPSGGPLLKPRNEQWCAGCAQQGHLDFECESYKYIRDYPATSPNIFHYSDIYYKLPVTTDNNHGESTRRDTTVPILNNSLNLPNSNSLVPYSPQNIVPLHQQNAPVNQFHNILNPFINPNFLSNPVSLMPNPVSLMPNQRMSLNVPQNIPPLFPSQNNFQQNINAPLPLGSDNLQVQVSSEDHIVSHRRDNRNMHIKRFRDSSLRELVEFLEGELSKLQKMPSEAKIWKKKLLTVENLQKNKSERTEAMQKRINFMYKLINMYIFGVRKLKDGKRHLDYLRNFIYQPGQELRFPKRKLLCDAYNYIFGNQHPNVNYHTLLNNLVVNSKMGRPLI